MPKEFKILFYPDNFLELFIYESIFQRDEFSKIKTGTMRQENEKKYMF